ncbi:hypothetical protein Q0Z83_080510 [Actinoplanes sichuanensis]|uniref:Secreted protein n=1 Tax=Actinoplanes sichuanensis TaxID=512349 RepID=A0ABW4AD29_9ACTN|nr:hypothetical protein [Actinoplanes sichuanensis]BEL09860.1 hypothetical protein Q0Z83_080510 [Actinoplanes sichuanensis]
MNRMWNARIAAVASAILLSAAVSGPAQAAPVSWSVVNGAASATGTLEYRSVTAGRYADVVGAISVAESDGQCYYLRYYVPADLLGRGFNSARQCGEGVLPVESHTFLSLFGTYGFRFGLCRVAPGAPEEVSFADLGASCVRV